MISKTRTPSSPGRAWGHFSVSLASGADASFPERQLSRVHGPKRRPTIAETGDNEAWAVTAKAGINASFRRALFFSFRVARTICPS